MTRRELIQLASARTCSVVESAPQATRIEMVFHLAVLPPWAQGAIRHAPQVPQNFPYTPQTAARTPADVGDATGYKGKCG